MWGVGRLELHRICNRRLVYKEVVETCSDYKKSYLWRFRNIACGGSTGSNRIKKDRVCVSRGLVWERGRRGGVL